MKSIDGFPVLTTINFLPSEPDPEINAWSYGKVTKIYPKDFYFTPRNIAWKGQDVRVGDYDLFIMMIGQWMKVNGLTKDDALNEYFEMAS